MVLQKVVHTKEDFVVLDIVTEQISSEKFLISKQKTRSQPQRSSRCDQIGIFFLTIVPELFLRTKISTLQFRILRI